MTNEYPLGQFNSIVNVYVDRSRREGRRKSSRRNVKSLVEYLKESSDVFEHRLYKKRRLRRLGATLDADGADARASIEPDLSPTLSDTEANKLEQTSATRSIS